ncbi:MAG: DMT family transporter, partial [Actinomycetes bacterium]
IFTVAVVAGQNSNSLVVDRLGLGPQGVQPFTLRRVIAAVIATIGVGIAVSDQFGGAGLAVGALLFALVAGAFVAAQQAVNGRVSGAAGSPWTAGLANFTAGWIGLSLALLISHLVIPHGWTIPPVPWQHPVLWLGGVIGVAFIVVAASVIHLLGVLLFSLLSIAGQVTGALFLDFAFPQAGHEFGWVLVVGVIVTGAAAALAAFGRRPVRA